MINSTKITEAADIITDTVKPYEKTRPYLDTGGLQLSDIQEIKHFSYNEKPSRANLNIKSGDLILARMQSTVKARLIIEEDEDLMISTGFLVLRPVKSTI
jgi:type I restriction enzyme S subunit